MSISSSEIFPNPVLQVHYSLCEPLVQLYGAFVTDFNGVVGCYRIVSSLLQDVSVPKFSTFMVWRIIGDFS